MSTPTTGKAGKPVEKPARPGRILLTLGILMLTMAAALFSGIQFSDAEPTPKLALDLEGGTQLILTPRTTDGSQIGDEDINQAISIIRQRVDASGVAEAEITRQGQQNIVVALPGEPDPSTLDLVRQSAQMRFRAVIQVADPAPMTPELLRAIRQQEAGEEVTPIDPTAPKPSQDEIDAAAMEYLDTDGDGELVQEPETTPTSASDTAWISEQLEYEFWRLDCTDIANLAGGDTYDPAQPAIACAVDGSSKYILGPAELEGGDLSQANSGPRTTATGAITNQFAVFLTFDSEGAAKFGTVTTRLTGLPWPQNQFAIVLDGLVISAPTINEPIPSGQAEISGETFTAQSTAALANQLSFGSLPLNFEVQSEEQISATLGIEQLERGILAGAIGLGLVVIYMLVQYHA
ncbi:MAG: protein translocase subunit SecD, partial [bacterium]|nr:protein translocase subunit SecD [bacterium]